MVPQLLHCLRFPENMVWLAMDQFSYLLDPQHRLVLLGIVFLILAAMSMLSGETLQRGRSIVYRAEEPRRFWWDVVIWIVAGLISIGVYLYQDSK